MKKISPIAFTVAALAFVPLLAFALTSPPTTPPSGVYTNVTDYMNLLKVVTQWVFYIIVIASVLVLVWAAYLYLTASGDEDQIGKAKAMILGAVIALFIAFVASGIPSLVGTFVTGTP